MKNPAVILITGASGGIGAALAERYAGKGKTLFLCARRPDKLAETAEKCRQKGAVVYTEKQDVTDADGMRNFIARCDKIAPIDLVVANAGVSVGGDGGLETEEQTRAVFDTNIYGVLNTVFPAVEKFRARKKGQIAVVSSLAGYRGLPGAAAYSASKNCVRAWGEALRGCLKKDDIEVSVICPGFVKSGITAKNKFPMPFLMETAAAADYIAKKLAKNQGRVTFPWPLAFAVWAFSCLPARLTEWVYAVLPAKNS